MAVTREFAKLKQKLMPYIYAEAKQAVADGISLMRPMYLEFPDDPNCAPLDRQYMLGSEIMVAPVMTENGDVDYYLPAGTWEHVIDHRVVTVEQGGKWFAENYDFHSLPLFKRI